jgi:hypothetical protein
MSSDNLAFELSQSFLEKFEKFAESNNEAFRRAAPFPHTVADGLFDDRLIDLILREYSARGDSMWQHYDDGDIQLKVRTKWKIDADIRRDMREVVRTVVLLASTPL